MIQLSNANFINLTFGMESTFIAEAVEYALNPYETYPNTSSVGTNAFEVNLYNYSTRAYLNVSNLTTPFPMYFPISKNYNLTSFA